MRPLLSALLLASLATPALASPWNAPDSTRPAPWGGRARAPQVLVPWSISFGGPSSIDLVTGEQTWTESFGGEGTGGDSGSNDSSSSSSDSSSSCGGHDSGQDSSSNSCGPNGSDF
jgi:hypothetical protein